MTTLNEYLKKKVVKGDIGIEIEVEGNHLKEVNNAVWRSEDDGSLRGHYPDSRCEYILATPIGVEHVLVAVEGLKEELRESEFKFSYRTSVHVHVNVQKMKLEQLLSMMYTYYLLEEPMMNFCGKARKGNNFCLRLADAEGVLEHVMHMFEEGFDGIAHIPGDMARYAAMNIEAIRKYGSLEFRGMEGNMDANRIDIWCRALIALRNYGETKNSPKEVYQEFMEVGAEGFMNNVLGDLQEHFKYARVYKDMETSFSISIDLPFSYRVPEIKKNYWEYGEGDLVGYEDAVKIQGNGGSVANSGRHNKWIVTNKAQQPKAKVKIPKAFAPVEWNQVIIDELGPVAVRPDEDF